MKTFKSILCSITLSAVIGMVPATSTAATLMNAAAITMAPEGSSNVYNIQHRKEWRRKKPNHRHSYRERSHKRGYWNGHRGQTHSRPNYRRHSDGLWYPLAAFGLGAIIGGAIASQPQPAPAYRGRVMTKAHVDWCYDRYRSYRASDDTFQPYNGPRQPCRSPY